jgi:hypothetical protein
MHVYTYRCKPINMHQEMYTSVSKLHVTYVRVFSYAYTNLHYIFKTRVDGIFSYECMYTRIYMYVYKCMHIYVCIHVFVHVYTHV